MFEKILIANRGAIACRIIRTCRKMGIKTVAVYTEADRSSMHVDMADEAWHIGDDKASSTYLNHDRILEIAHLSMADAIHPGYGFLSENIRFAHDCEERGIIFIGPAPRHISSFGLKHTARELALASNVPLLPGSSLLDNLQAAHDEADNVGYPVMLKSTAGGGGIGMRLCRHPDQLASAYEAVRELGQNNFGDGGIFLEKYIENARHIEVQVFGDGTGHVLALGERDCSLQRRNQKVVEETPAPGLSAVQRESIYQSAIRLMESVQYRSAGTVEFIYDPATRQFYFLEVNTRLQVEHGITEEVTGIDLVDWMIRLASGDIDFLKNYHHHSSGHAIQVRLYAEDPARQFQPDSGTITGLKLPEDARCDTWLQPGTEVTPWYDPLLAKIIYKGNDREAAINGLLKNLDKTAINGLETNLDYLKQVVSSGEFRRNEHHTRLLDSFLYYHESAIVLEPGTQTTVQDFPGRTGYWHVGVPPSGPMDSLSFRLGNAMLGNTPDAAGLEILLTGPCLKFSVDTQVVITGADIDITINGETVPVWTILSLSAGDILKTGSVTGNGARSYLLIKGGIQVPDYLGSKSTFTLGLFGGLRGATLKTGDVVHLQNSLTPVHCKSLPSTYRPVIHPVMNIRVIYGPHGAPDYFTDADIEKFFDSEWVVHFNSSRTGIRLIGPAPEWARTDGGEAGLHPSNIHDTPYAIGSIDYTGDMPVILGPDGPSLGGFVCPATVIKADLWKLGQLKAGDRIRFMPVDMKLAASAENQQNNYINNLGIFPPEDYSICKPDTCVIDHRPKSPRLPEINIRPSGEDNLLIEFGPMILDLELRFYVHGLMQWLADNPHNCIREVTPGIRSIQVNFDSLQITATELIEYIYQSEDSLSRLDDMVVSSRVVHLPLSWDDISTQIAIEKYSQTVRADAPWCPSNIEFIRRINGLDSVGDVKSILFDASYIVLGLGDVYLGAPVATPMDPRHRLVTTKYNPARTWTPENAVGIGGSYLCIYGMEGPGGYQFVGRTLQMWNRYRETTSFQGNTRWLLRYFDQIRFYPVTTDELDVIRKDFPLGRYTPSIQTTTLSLRDYRQFLVNNQHAIDEFKHRQQCAFEEERERWIKSGDSVFISVKSEAIPEPDSGAITFHKDESPVYATLPGSVWKLLVEPGQEVTRDQPLIIIESMKMEFHVIAHTDGKVTRLTCSKGQQISQGQMLAIITSAQ